MRRIEQAAGPGWLNGILLAAFMLVSVVANDVEDSQTALVPDGQRCVL